MKRGQLLLIGLGLYDETDLSIKAIQEIKTCDFVYAEFYTSSLVGTTKDRIEHTIGKPIQILSREETENNEKILQRAENENVAFLVGGDPMTATTHLDLRLSAIKRGIPTRIIHSSSIVTAVPGLLGLQNYKFGRTTTLAYPEKNYFPVSPYHIIKENKERGLHTLVLLDIQAEKKRYMTANEGLQLLLQMEQKVGEKIINDTTVACVVARAGSKNPILRADTIHSLQSIDFGPPLHTIVIPGNLHFMELEALVTIAGLPNKIAETMQKP